MPTTMEQVPAGPELDLKKSLENELGPIPGQLQEPVRWAGSEQAELAEAAAKSAPEDPTLWRKIRTKVGSRMVVTGLAVATLMPMLAPSAEAGERGRNWRRAGTIVSILGGVGEQVFAARQYAHQQRAERMGYQLQMLQNEGEELVRRMRMLDERQGDLDAQMRFEKRPERKERLEYEMHRVDVAKDGLRARAVQIDAQIAKLGPEFVKEAKAAGKDSLFRHISEIAGSEGRQMRWGGY